MLCMSTSFCCSTVSFLAVDLQPPFLFAAFQMSSISFKAEFISILCYFFVLGA